MPKATDEIPSATRRTQWKSSAANGPNIIKLKVTLEFRNPTGYRYNRIYIKKGRINYQNF